MPHLAARVLKALMLPLLDTRDVRVEEKRRSSRRREGGAVSQRFVLWWGTVGHVRAAFRVPLEIIGVLFRLAFDMAVVHSCRPLICSLLSALSVS